jgi:hypothetical protein
LLNDHKYFPGRLAAPETVGLSRSCPFLSRATNAIGKPNVRTRSNFRVAKFADSPRLAAPIGIAGERIAQDLPPISATISDNKI